MYTELISENFANPTHNGVLDKATAILKNFDPVCGDKSQISLEIDRFNLISTARFQAWGCVTSIAAVNIFCRWLEGKSVQEVCNTQPESLAELLGELRPEQIHCIDILVNLIEQFKCDLDMTQA